MPDRRQSPNAVKAESMVQIGVEGMSCASCAARVEKSIAKVAGVERVTVNLATKVASVKGSAKADDLRRAVAEAGYKPLGGDDAGQGTAAPDTIEPAIEQMQKRELLSLATLKRDLLLAVFLTLPVLAISMLMLDFTGSGLVQLLLTTPVVFGCGARFFVTTGRLARHFSANMDTLVALGSSSSYAASLWGLTRSGDLYFETAAMIITLILLGRYLEERAKVVSTDAIRRLIRLRPEVAHLKTKGQEIDVGVASLRLGDLLVVRPGDSIPTDGVVVDGDSSVDEAMITGESMPITKKSGDVVLGGTLNGEGMLVVRVDKVGPDTVLASMIRQVEEAQGSKAPIQRLADHVSAYMVPAVLLVALIVLVAWRASGATTAVALHAAIAVLVVACPCSLGLATPMGIMVGTGRAAKRGILVRNATALERAHAMTVCIMDKTGTLTMGRPEVREFVNQSSLAEETLLRAVAGVERYSQHPLATALVRYAKERGLEPLPVQNFKAVTGQGAVADVRLDDGVILPLAIGSREMALRGQAGVGDSGDLAEERARGATVIFIGTEGRLLGQAAIADRPRPDAAAQIKRLGRMGIRVIMATGDNILTAGVVAKAMGIAEVHADLKPEGKVHLVESLQGSGEVVGMVGDGVNDAAALVKADVGFAIGSGSDVALASASLTLVKGELAKVVEALQISRETIKIIKQNLFWSFFYNGLAIPLAALGFLSPMLAAAAMVTSSVAVVTNSLRLRHKSLGL